jgi:hypothetical protein
MLILCRLLVPSYQVERDHKLLMEDHGSLKTLISYFARLSSQISLSRTGEETLVIFFFPSLSQG